MNTWTIELCIVGLALFVVQVGVIVVGVALDSEAMQWTGFVVITVVLLAGVRVLFDRFSFLRAQETERQVMRARDGVEAGDD